MPGMRMRAVVSGYVQGVGYRWFARQQALTLGLTGYVRNLANGHVEVVAAGPRASLDRFVAALQRGPEGADVDDVALTWESGGANEGDYVGFTIRR